jgi:hypothetical protein
MKILILRDKGTTLETIDTLLTNFSVYNIMYRNVNFAVIETHTSCEYQLNNNPIYSPE